jgi:hypothetical protein
MTTHFTALAFHLVSKLFHAIIDAAFNCMLFLTLFYRTKKKVACCRCKCACVQQELLVIWAPCNMGHLFAHKHMHINTCTEQQYIHTQHAHTHTHTHMQGGFANADLDSPLRLSLIHKRRRIERDARSFQAVTDPTSLAPLPPPPPAPEMEPLWCALLHIV